MADDKRNPGTERMLFKTIELFLRAFVPFVNMLSAIFRIAGLIFHYLFTDQEIAHH